MKHSAASLDRLHSERVDLFHRRLKEGHEWRDDELFVSEGILSTIHGDKALLTHYRLGDILELLPFSSKVYVELCYNCLSPANLPEFETLVRRGLVVPLLLSRYQEYPGPVLNIVSGNDHISRYEYATYRFRKLRLISSEMVCHHCVERQEKDISEAVKNRSNADKYQSYARGALANLYPFIGNDWELIVELSEAAKARRLRVVSQLADLSGVVHELRSTQAFEAEFVRDLGMFSNLPEGLSDDSDEIREISVPMQKQLADGFGLKVPLGGNLEEYIDIAKEYQPRFRAIINQMASSSLENEDKELSSQLLAAQMKINAEVERLKNLRRFMVLEAAIEVLRNNKPLVMTSLLAGALGLSTGLVGCAAGVGVGIATKVATKAGLLKESVAAKKLLRKVQGDIQPYLDKLIAAYTGTLTPAVSIVTLKKQLSNST